MVLSQARGNAVLYQAKERNAERARHHSDSKVSPN
jgi:hypothetical protein